MHAAVFTDYFLLKTLHLTSAFALFASLGAILLTSNRPKLAMILHGARVNLTPFPMPNIEGLLGEEGLAEDMIRELDRGTTVKVDLGDAWNFWDYAEAPIEEMRERLGITPRHDSRVAGSV